MAFSKVPTVWIPSYQYNRVFGLVSLSSGLVTTESAHGFSSGQPVYFTGLSGTTDVSNNTVYYVSATGLTSTTFQFSATNGGSDITTAAATVTGATTSPVVFNSASTVSIALSDWGGLTDANADASSGNIEEIYNKFDVARVAAWVAQGINVGTMMTISRASLSANSSTGVVTQTFFQKYNIVLDTISVQAEP